MLQEKWGERGKGVSTQTHNFGDILAIETLAEDCYYKEVNH